ncbi:hypothetical protein ABPG72_005880 [Tetrahymena utriculariae]
MSQLTFTNAKIEGSPYFFYSKFDVLDEIDTFSRILEKDLMKYLGIQNQIIKKEQLAKALTNNSKNYDTIQIDRLKQLYSFYIETILDFMMQIQYNIKDQVRFDNIANFNTDMQDQEIIYDTGRTYQESFEIALMKTKSLKDEIDSLINDEFPVETFQDKQTKNIKPRLKK